MLPLLKATCEKNGKSFVTIVGDNGPDMNPTSYLNIFYFGRLWRDIGLTKLTTITYPAGRSAYNPIEHAWSPLSNKLTGVVIPAVLDGEDLPPNKQTGLSKEEINEKSAKMLDNASKTLKEYWDNLHYDGYAVVPVAVKSSDQTGSYDDHDAIHRLIYATAKAQEEDKILKQLVKEFKFLCYHADRRRNFVAFSKCQLLRPGKECSWCCSHPPKECEALDFEKHLNGLWFDPVPSETHPGHFKTYLESKDDKISHQHDLFGVGKCSVCNNWWFSSITEMKRHCRLLHPKIKFGMLIETSDDKKQGESQKSHVCRHGGCNKVFPTYHKLLLHKNETGHKRDRKKKAADAKDQEISAAKKRKVENQIF